MCALPENRRRFVDVSRLGCAFPSLFSSDTKHLSDLLSSKMPRITSMSFFPDRPISFQPSETSTSKIRKFPPPSPLPRAVHAPQRHSKPFASSVRKPQPEVNQVLEEVQRLGKMGNFVSTVENWVRVKEAKAEALGFLRWPGKGEMASNADNEYSKDGNVISECLSVEEYRRLVDEAVSDQASTDICLLEPTSPGSHFQLPSSDVSVILTSKYDDAGKTMDSPIVNHVVEEEWLRRPPLYKELYESSKRHDSKLSILDFRLAQMKMSALKLIDRAEEVVPREPFLPLTEEEEDFVSHALCGSNRRELLVVHESSNIEITREVLQCLKPGAWLNDEVINVYLELLKERERRDPKRFMKCHFFNTFFYKKIFVPIHKEIHWCLAVINVKDGKFQYLDSLKGMDVLVLKVLARYFVDEVKDKSDKDINVSSWKQEFVDDIPEQKNGWDCGMFMIKYADFYSRGLKLCFSQEHMLYFRKRTVREILRLSAE